MSRAICAGGDGVPSDVKARLSPETQELVAHAGYQAVKQITKQDVVTLS